MTPPQTNDVAYTLEIRNLHANAGDTQILNGINLTVPPSWRIERAAGKVVISAPEAGSYMAVLDAAALAELLRD